MTTTPASGRRSVFAGLRVTSLATMGSRLLGMFRDVLMASLFGLSASAVMDAFVVAFRIPNLSRRLFGEGALTASYVPELSRQVIQDRQLAWRLASVLLTWLAALLLVLLLLAEIGCLLLYWYWQGDERAVLLLGLTATLLPYMVLICLTAQLAATLHALSHFTVPALTPILLNLCWILAIWWFCPAWEHDPARQAYIISIAILISGVLQLAVQLYPLRQLGFRYDYNWQAARGPLARVAGQLMPMMFGLAVTQLNALLDVTIAWGLAAAADGPSFFTLLGQRIPYPLTQGAAAAAYFGERMYQFPLGILGVAVATVIFPRLSQHVARGEREKIGVDLTMGLRLIAVWAIPASVGLVLLAEPIARLLFEHGEFTDRDTLRTARMIVGYGAGVWAYCALPVLVRGFYALEDTLTPARCGMVCVLLNGALNVLLIWPLAEQGLAISTSLAAVLQVGLLAAAFGRRHQQIEWSRLAMTVRRAVLATAAMAVACLLLLQVFSAAERFVMQVLVVLVPTAGGILVYVGAARLIFRSDWSVLWGMAAFPDENPEGNPAGGSNGKTD